MKAKPSRSRKRVIRLEDLAPRRDPKGGSATRVFGETVEAEIPPPPAEPPHPPAKPRR